MDVSRAIYADDIHDRMAIYMNCAHDYVMLIAMLLPLPLHQSIRPLSVRAMTLSFVLQQGQQGRGGHERG